MRHTKHATLHHPAFEDAVVKRLEFSGSDADRVNALLSDCNQFASGHEFLLIDAEASDADQRVETLNEFAVILTSDSMQSKIAELDNDAGAVFFAEVGLSELRRRDYGFRIADGLFNETLRLSIVGIEMFDLCREAAEADAHLTFRRVFSGDSFRNIRELEDFNDVLSLRKEKPRSTPNLNTPRFARGVNEIR